MLNNVAVRLAGEKEAEIGASEVRRRRYVAEGRNKWH